MQLHILSTKQHQLLRQLFIQYREFKLVGLQTGSLGAESRLNKLSFVGLKDQTFVYHIVQLATLNTLAKYEIVTEIAE